MALIESWAERGEAILDDRSVEQRTYRVGQEDDFIDYKEVVDKNVNRWVGFNEDAASAHIDTNEQPSDVTIANSWSMNEDQRVVGSYTITRSQEKKTVSVVGSTPTPVIGSITFSVATNTDTTFPFNLTMSTSTAGAVIRYRLDSYDGATKITGAWQVSSGASQTISVNTTNIAGGASIGGVAYHKYIIIEAYAYRVLQTGAYEGPRSSRTYGYRSPVLLSLSKDGRPHFDVGAYSDFGANGTLNLDINNPQSHPYTMKYGYGTNQGNYLTTQINVAGWTEFVGQPTNTYTGNFSFAIARATPQNTPLKYAIYVGPSRNNSGYRLILRVQIQQLVALDGKNYSIIIDRAFYGDYDPF
jgi:hypothetical protein